MNLICVLFLLYSPLRSSFVNDVFDFNAPVNDPDPLSPMMLSVDCVRMDSVDWLMNVIYVLFLLSSLLISS